MDTADNHKAVVAPHTVVLRTVGPADTDLAAEGLGANIQDHQGLDYNLLHMEADHTVVAQQDKEVQLAGQEGHHKEAVDIRPGSRNRLDSLLEEDQIGNFRGGVDLGINGLPDLRMDGHS